MEDSRSVKEFQILGGGDIWQFRIIWGDLSPLMSMVVTALVWSKGKIQKYFIYLLQREYVLFSQFFIKSSLILNQP